MSLAVGDLSEGFGCALLVGDLTAEKVAGFRWVRERIGRVDLAGESLIERSHRAQIRWAEREGSDRSDPTPPTSVLQFAFLCSSASQGETERFHHLLFLLPKPKRGKRKWTGWNTGFSGQASADRAAPACSWVLGVLLTRG